MARGPRRPLTAHATSAGALCHFSNTSLRAAGPDRTSLVRRVGRTTGLPWVLRGVVLAGGSLHTCAARSSGVVVCREDDRFGGLLAGGPEVVAVPVAVAGL